MSTDKHPSIVCGLIGSGIQASLTPAMHEQEGEAKAFAMCIKRSTSIPWA